MTDRLLVTGGTGLAGSNIAMLANERGWNVRVLVRSEAEYAEFRSAGIEIVLGDITEPASLLPAFENVTHVVHAAASIAGTWSRATAESHDLVNHRGGLNVLDAAAQAGISRLVWIDTVSILDSSFTLTERSPIVEVAAPASPYVSSKLKAYYAALYRSASGLPISFVTPGCIYGPGPFVERAMDPASFTSILQHGISGQIESYVTFPLYWTFVRDLAEICLRAVEKGSNGARYLSVGRSEDVASLSEFCNRGSEIAGSTYRVAEIDPLAEGGPDIGTMKQFALRTYGSPYIDASLTERELGYSPTSRDDGTRTTIEWFRQNGLL